MFGYIRDNEESFNFIVKYITLLVYIINMVCMWSILGNKTIVFLTLI